MTAGRRRRQDIRRNVRGITRKFAGGEWARELRYPSPCERMSRACRVHRRLPRRCAGPVTDRWRTTARPCWTLTSLNCGGARPATSGGETDRRSTMSTTAPASAGRTRWRSRLASTASRRSTSRPSAGVPERTVQLTTARLCLNCEEVHDAQSCPGCASETFVYMTRWVPHSRRAPRAAMPPRVAPPVRRRTANAIPGLIALALSQWFKRAQTRLELIALGKAGELR